MQIVSEEQHRALAFVDTASAGGYLPLASEVERWMRDPSPRAASYRTEFIQSPVASSALGVAPQADAFGGVIEQLRRTVAASLEPAMRDITAGLARSMYGSDGSSRARTRRVVETPAESVVEHAVRIGWMSRSGDDDDPRLDLTPLGSALLRRVDVEVVDEDLQVVVLGAGDSLAYPRLVGQLARYGPGLLVDPYLKLSQMVDLMRHTEIDRFLMSKEGRQAQEYASIQLVVDRDAGELEVRASTALHDRYFLPVDGAAFSIGTSLNGVGRRSTTVFSPVPEPAVRTIRDHYEGLWVAAEEQEAQENPEGKS